MAHTHPDYIAVYWTIAFIAILSAIAISAGTIFFTQALGNFRTRRLIEDTPRSQIGAMAMGLVEVQAQIAHGSEHPAPFSGVPCAYWEVTVEWPRIPGVWPVAHCNASGNPFFVRDETGVALVLPKGAEIKGLHNLEETCLAKELPEYYARYLKEHHLGSPRNWERSQIRFTERRLGEGEGVFLLGTAVPRSQALDVSQDAALPATSTNSAHEHHIRELQSQTVATICQGECDRLFIISPQSERNVLRQYGWAKLIGGPALAMFGLYFFLMLIFAMRWITP